MFKRARREFIDEFSKDDYIAKQKARLKTFTGGLGMNPCVEIEDQEKKSQVPGSIRMCISTLSFMIVALYLFDVVFSYKFSS